MNPVVIHLGLISAFFILGVLTALTFGGTKIESIDRWEPLAPLTGNRSEDALERLIASGRWEIETEEVQETIETGPTGEFSEDYLLVGIVNGESPYALLSPRHGNDDHSILSVKLGDLLESGWAISEISDVEVIAERNGDSQTVELFRSE